MLAFCTHVAEKNWKLILMRCLIEFSSLIRIITLLCAGRMFHSIIRHEIALHILCCQDFTFVVQTGITVAHWFFIMPRVSRIISCCLKANKTQTRFSSYFLLFVLIFATLRVGNCFLICSILGAASAIRGYVFFFPRNRIPARQILGAKRTAWDTFAQPTVCYLFALCGTPFWTSADHSFPTLVAGGAPRNSLFLLAANSLSRDSVGWIH